MAPLHVATLKSIAPLHVATLAVQTELPKKLISI